MAAGSTPGGFVLDPLSVMSGFTMVFNYFLICVHEHSVLTAPGTLANNYPFVKETHHPLIPLDPLTLPH